MAQEKAGEVITPSPAENQTGAGIMPQTLEKSKPRATRKPPGLAPSVVTTVTEASVKPHDVNAEKALLGILLRDNQLLKTVAPLVTAREFYVYAHQKIFIAISAVVAEGNTADLVTVASWLKAHHADEDAGGPSHLVGLWTDATSSANAAKYAAIIRNHFKLRQLIETARTTYQRAQDPGADPAEIASVASDAISGIVTATAADLPRFDFAPITSGTFAATDYPTEWLLRQLIVRGQPCIVGGPKKSLKTSLILDLGISIGSGTSFLGLFQVTRPLRVCILSGESGERTLKETALRVCRAKGIDLADADVLWSFSLPQLAVTEDVAKLTNGIRVNKIDVLILDPLYLSLLANIGQHGLSAANMFDVGPLLMRISKGCLAAGCTPILIHHARKNVGNGMEPLDLEDLAYSGCQEFARQWLLLSRREKYEPGSGQHLLWLSAGGSSGHSGLWAIDVDEGTPGDDFDGRRWDVTVTPAREARQSAADVAQERRAQAENQKLRDKQTKLLNALDSREIEKTADGWASYNKVRDAAGLNAQAMEHVAFTLREERILESDGSPGKRRIRRRPDS